MINIFVNIPLKCCLQMKGQVEKWDVDAVEGIARWKREKLYRNIFLEFFCFGVNFSQRWETWRENIR